MLANANLSHDGRGERAPVSATAGVRLAELLGRLSLAFDIANDAPYGKGVRSVVLAVELGRLAGATSDELHDTFWVALLSYLGCTGVTQDGELSDTSIKLGHIVGAGPRVLSSLKLHHGCSDERGRPDRLASNALALPMRLLRVAHVGDTAHQQHGQAGAVAVVQRRAGSELDARLARLLVDGQRELFAAIEDPRIFDRFLELEPSPAACADDDRVDEAARALATFADLEVSDLPRPLDPRGGACGASRRAGGPERG